MSDETPLRKITFNAFDSDCDWFEQRYGYGWSTQLRELMHRHVTDTNRSEEPYIPNENTVRLTLDQWAKLNDR